MLTSQLHFFPILEHREIRIAYQISMSAYVCFNCHLVWYQEEMENEIRCSSCPNMAQGYVLSSSIHGTDVPWEEFCQMLQILGPMVDASLSGMLIEGMYFSHKDMQVIFTTLTNEKHEIFPIWRLFLGSDGFTRNVPEMKIWLNEGFYLRDYITKNGWPEEAKEKEQEIELDEKDVLSEVESMFRKEI